MQGDVWAFSVNKSRNKGEHRGIQENTEVFMGIQELTFFPRYTNFKKNLHGDHLTKLSFCLNLWWQTMACKLAVSPTIQTLLVEIRGF